MTPQGRFGVALDPDAERHYLAIAAGSGITPVMSIIRAVLTHEPKSRVTLIYGNRSTQSIIFREQLEDLKDRFLSRFTVHHILSREAQEIALLDGRIDADKLAALLRTLPTDDIDVAFLCGPGGLIEEGRAALTHYGVPAERIHVEYFSTDGTPVAARAAAPTVAASAQEAVVRMTLNGARHEVPVHAGETIVDAGLRAGSGDAVFMSGGHVLHVSCESHRRRSGDGHQLFAGAVGAGSRLCADLPVAPDHAGGGAGLRRGLATPPRRRAGTARSCRR